jgi:hypothetical protein
MARDNQIIKEDRRLFPLLVCIDLLKNVQVYLVEQSVAGGRKGKPAYRGEIENRYEGVY